MKSNNKIRLLRITTVPISLKLLLNGQLAHLTKRNFEILAVSADGPEIVNHSIEGIPHRVVHMTRKITPLHDLISLVKLIMVIAKFRPDIVHTHTPKAGLLGMIAAWVCGVPVRMHTVAGLPLIEKTGILRKILIQVERITYWCATSVYPNSLGLKDFIIQSIGSSYSLKIIGRGSSNGIDTRHFSRNAILESESAGVRKKFGIADGDLVFSFVGRVVRDKGIGELVSAFRKIREQSANRKMFLLIIGPLEQELDPIDDDDLRFLREDRNVVLAGYQSDVRPWIMASDIFVFPSYREGFPNVVMQASCLEVPCIVSDINGCNEIIENDKTGLIVKPKDAEGLYKAMTWLSTNESMRKQFARAAKEKIVSDYDQRFVWEELEKEYRSKLREKGSRQKNRIYVRFIKPFFDTVVGLLVLLVTSPVIILCMILLAMANKGKIWFTQTRPGKNGRLFKVIKFRTMSEARNESGELLPDEDRLHAIGRFIRKTSLDEIPQLINVVKGDMSIVGPRPLLEEYLGLYSEDQMLRHNVKPGITGWAQVNGRNTLSWEQKFAYDVWYVDNISFWLDVKILFMTVFKVFKAEGISSTTSATMEKFRGNRPNYDI